MPAPNPLTVPGCGGHAGSLAMNTAGCSAVEWQGRIYYTDGRMILSMEPDGADVAVFRKEGSFAFLNAAGGSLFYYSGDDNRIHRIDFDGKAYQSEELGGKLEYLSYCDGFLYYSRTDKNKSDRDVFLWCRMRSNLTCPEQLCDMPVKPDHIYMTDDWMYYRGSDRNIYRWSRKDMQTIQSLYRGSAGGLILDGDTLYVPSADAAAVTVLSVETPQWRREQTHLPGTESIGALSMTVNGYILFSASQGSSYGICRYDPESGMFSRVTETDAPVQAFCAAGDWLFVESADARTGKIVYAVRLSGGVERQILDHNGKLLTDSLDGWKDAPIVWEDAAVEQCIRTALGKLAGDVTFRDVYDVEELTLYGNAVGAVDGSSQSVTFTDKGVICGDTAYAFGRIGSLADFRYFPHLRRLHFRGGSITCSMEPLAALPALEELTLNNTGFGVYLGSLKQLRKLSVWDTSCTDLSVLRGLTGLELLVLYLNPNTDDYTVLAELPSLKEVYFIGNIGSRQQEALKALYPDLRIRTGAVPSVRCGLTA